jgi:hypothetical protein
MQTVILETTVKKINKQLYGNEVEVFWDIVLRQLVHGLTE